METERQPDKIIVHCTGKVNLQSWTQFSRTVRGLLAEHKPIRVDLANVLQVDSTGIGAFVRTRMDIHTPLQGWSSAT